MDKYDTDLNELRRNVRSDEAKEAFDYLVQEFRDLGRLGAKKGKHGYITDVRVETEVGNCFAFIPNRGSLTCYFRRPALSRGLFSDATIQRLFPDAEWTNGREWKVIVRNRQDATKVAAYVCSSLKNR